MLYLSRLQLTNIRCFQDACISFVGSAEQESKTAIPVIPWTLILGNNGTGKSTILRSVALSTSSETSASGLLREINGPMIRTGATEGTITAHFNDDDGRSKHSVTTTLLRSLGGEEELHRESEMTIPADRLFVCAYGANRRSIGAPPVDRYTLLESMFTLFNYESAQLREPETVILRLIRKGWNEKDLLEYIDKVLMLPVGSTRLGDTGIEISGPWGSFVPFGALGDGYVAVLAMLVDLLGWSILFNPNRGSPIQGMILIDEIEQHLHPLWQKRIVAILQEALPTVQFIASTHAPLVATGAADIGLHECQLVLCEEQGGEVTCRDGLSAPRGLRADQVLTSFLFGLNSTASASVKMAIERMSELRRKQSLSEEEKTDLASIKQDLDVALGAESEDEEIIRRALDRALESILQEQLQSHDPETARLELRRQLQELLRPSA